MEQQKLFEVGGEEAAVREEDAARQAAPRLVTADRSQIELRLLDLDGLIPADHRARLIWQAVE